MPPHVLGLALLLVNPLPEISDEKTNEKSVKNLVRIEKGTLPIILSAPHGGKRIIPGVPPRQGEGVAQFAIVRDENTDALARALARELARVMGGRPHMVVAAFDRKYLDVNRPTSGAYESEKAKRIYDTYHEALADACRTVKQTHGRGLLLDLHGQGAQEDVVFRGTSAGKTVTLLVQRFGQKAFTGPRSLLGQLEARGYRVFPPGESDEHEDRRFGGGYIVRTYGSHTGYGIDAIQLEWGMRYRTKNVMTKTAQDLAEAIQTFAGDYLPQGKP